MDAHNRLIAGVNTQVAALGDAERACANQIDALYFGLQYVPDNGDATADPAEYGFSADLFGQAAGDASAGLPWGTDESETYGFWGSCGQFFVGLGDGVWSGVKGVGALVGVEGGDAFKNAWTGVGNLTGINGADRFDAGWTRVWKAATDWDEWKTNPGKALGEVASNFLYAPSAAGKVGKFAVDAAEIGTKLKPVLLNAATRAGQWLDKAPTFGDLGDTARSLLPGGSPQLAGAGALASNDAFKSAKVFRTDSRRRTTGGSADDPANLDLHEQLGGHTKAKHVGKSLAYLKGRDLPYASTFVDLKAASKATAKNLQDNDAFIRNWLAGQESRLTIKTSMSPDGGIIYLRETDSIAPPKFVITRLVRIRFNHKSYLILTSFASLH